MSGGARAIRGKGRVVATAAILATLTGCGAATRTRAAGAVAPLAVRPVSWSASGAAFAHVQAVADAGDVVVVFGQDGATVVSSGAVTAIDHSVKDWVGAQTIRGADGSPRWIVGVDREGRLHHLHGRSSFEDVSARYGLEGRRVRQAAMLDGVHVAFLLEGEIAMADGSKVSRYATGAPLLDLAGGGGWGAGTARDSVMVFEAVNMAPRTYALPGVRSAAVGRDGRLYAATARALYVARPGGDLALVYDAQADSIRGLAASGDRVWFADGGELGVMEGDHVAETTGAGLPPDAKLSGSPSGDVWVIAGGKLQRYARADLQPSLVVSWNGTLAPIFARDCASCHLADGVSGTDLSTAQAWEGERASIERRVVLERSMPPDEHPISDADRETIRAWAEAKTSGPRN